MAKTTKSFLALLRGGNLGVPLVILCILAMVILPLPPALLDILFTFNIVLAVMVLLVAVSAKRPLEFSLFPTILLITTLMRLTLNVASTRVVLLHGHLGADAAGKVVESFGWGGGGGELVGGCEPRREAIAHITAEAPRRPARQMHQRRMAPALHPPVTAPPLLSLPRPRTRFTLIT
ncbi:FHIPEP family type III secretion protein, partial [Escherichia coli]|uniref:FHIPEP family type III secretion protein n=1 Tax=Escherichia coli TaxID=562 RepID=UPI0020260C42